MRSRRIHPQARFTPSHCEFPAFTTGARFATATAWSSTRTQLTYLAPDNMPYEIKPWVERTSESVRHDRSCDVAQDRPEKFNFNPEGGNAVMFGGCGKIEDTLANSPSRTAWWGAVN